MLAKTLIVLILLVIIGSLFSGLFYLVKDKGTSERTVRALTVRISLSVALFVLLMAGLILYETSNIIHGGETNYIMATVTLFVAIFNLFTSLMHLFGFMSGDE